jgi:xanthosine utilization system XapX-like protein
MIDSRGRFSLTHLQLVLWPLVVLSLVAGVFFGRLWAGVDDPLGFDIPSELLGVLGISVGSAVTAQCVKARTMS